MRARSITSALLLAATLALSAATAAFAAPEKVAGGIRFTYKDGNASNVSWAGAFNNWNGTANPMTKDANGVWTVVIALPAGEQQYKFVVDGNWVADPDNGATAGDFGNSVVRIGNAGELLKVAATSNTPYNPKINMGGRAIGLYRSTWSDVEYARYELERPELDMDLGFDIRMSDALMTKFLLNVNPRHENVQDYKSRLNFKRGSMTLTQPSFTLTMFDSEPLGTWDDPLHLVGAEGVYAHPFGYERAGFRLKTPKYGFDTEVLYTDNTAPGGVSSPGFGSFVTGNRAIAVEPSGAGWRLVHGAVSKATATDVGDNHGVYGYGDGDADLMAARIRRRVRDDLTVGVLGRSDRGFHFGTIDLLQATGDSSYVRWQGNDYQQSFGAGLDAQWSPRANVSVEAEFAMGGRRLVLTDGATRKDGKVATATETEVTATETTTDGAGAHFSLDESSRWVLRGHWTFAQGDVALHAGVERQDHTYPAWSQEPITPAGTPSIYHQRQLNVEYQRGDYLDDAELENHMTEWNLVWDRNWRYYLGRPVRTSLGVTWTNFRYDARTAWEHQLWFPNGNFWLSPGQHVVSVARMTLLGEPQAIELRPTIEYPIRRANAMSLTLTGHYATTRLDKKPRFAETIARFGFDANRAVRLQTDWRWARYDVPALDLQRGYLSQFTEAIYRFGDEASVSLGFGVDPYVVDRVTNEYAYVGREMFLEDLNANGWVAESNWFSLAPQLSAAEKSLQNTKRIQLKAVVHF
ncbi:MAG: glycogen-binding domain-containing protein [Candidatus Eisenbacteria bacterium]